MTSKREKPQALFLDRDGVINEEVDLLHDVSRLRLIPGSAVAIRQLNRAGIPVIVVTNQPVVARNLCTEEDLKAIHASLEELLLKEAGARIDAIYYCPHHPETHHPDGNPAYRIPCACRKPETGMLNQAAIDFHLDLKRCTLIGDSTRDMETGKRGGLRTILVRTGYGGKDKRFEAVPDEICQDLGEAVDRILGNRVS